MQRKTVFITYANVLLKNNKKICISITKGLLYENKP